MRVWLDAQLSPVLAPWLLAEFDLEEVVAIQTVVELVSARDREIFDAAKAADAIVMTKDRDFVDLLERLGPPPRVIWLTCGNTSNQALRRLLLRTFPAAARLIEGGEGLVEISG